MSAVSKNVIPASRAARTTAIVRSASIRLPKALQPRPTVLTVRPERPSCRYVMSLMALPSHVPVGRPDQSRRNGGPGVALRRRELWLGDEDRAGEVGVGEVRVAQVRADQIGQSEIGSAQVRPDQKGASQGRTPQVRLREVGADQVGSAAVLAIRYARPGQLTGPAQELCDLLTVSRDVVPLEHIGGQPGQLLGLPEAGLDVLPAGIQFGG